MFFIVLIYNNRVIGAWNRAWKEFLIGGGTHMGASAYESRASAERAIKRLKQRDPKAELVVSRSPHFVMAATGE